MAKGVEGLAATAVAVGRCRLAAQLFAAAEALRQAAGSWIDVADLPEHERFQEQARGQLGPRAYEAARRAGATFSAAEALARARHELSLPARSPAPTSASPPAREDPPRAVPGGLPGSPAPRP